VEGERERGRERTSAAILEPYSGLAYCRAALGLSAQNVPLPLRAAGTPTCCEFILLVWNRLFVGVNMPGEVAHQRSRMGTLGESAQESTQESTDKQKRTECVWGR
jgi:hypothetical protein